MPAVASDVSAIESSLIVDSVMLSDNDIMARISFKVLQQWHVIGMNCFLTGY